MNLKFSLPVAAVAVLSFAMGHVIGQGQKKLNQQTMANLSTAMHGEAFAYAKYLLFADHARKGGNAQLANLFEQTAKTERFDHFAKEAKLAGVVGSDSDNLKDAISGENYETTTMYRQFAEQAQKAGDQNVAAQFEEIRQDEMKHRDAFNTALAKVESGKPKRP